MKAKVSCTRPKYVCGNEHMKLVGTVDGLFPDFGHHLEGEMGGLWLYPVKILDGFWMRVQDIEAKTVDCWLTADDFENYPHKNVFHYGSGMGHTPVLIERTQMIPEEVNGLLVTYDFYLPKKSAHGSSHTIKMEYIVRSNLRPDWLAEEINVWDGDKDEARWNEAQQAFLMQDCQNPWFAMTGCDFSFDSYRIGEVYGSDLVRGNGTGISVLKEFVLHPGERKRFTFYTAASLESAGDCADEYLKLTGGKDFEKKKEAKMNRMLERTKLRIGDEAFEEIFDWVKIHTDWLTLDVKGIGRGVTAGIPEYCWWFGCDSCYAIQGILLQGDFALCRQTIQLILSYSRKMNGNGKIIHELLPNGVSPNLGNCQETAHFIYLLWEYYLWTGDQTLLAEAFDYISMGIDWLLEQDDDNDFFPTGYGIIEIAGLNMEMIDSAVYMSAAFSRYRKIADVLGRKIDAEKMDDFAEKSRLAINTLLWSEEENCYCDCFASAEKIAEKKDMILGQMKEANDAAAMEQFHAALEERLKTPEKEFGWLLNRNWVINTPMEAGLAPKDKAKKALERLHSDEFIGQYGMYLEGLRKHQTMTISSGVMAVAQARYGYSDRALEIIKKMFGTFSMATPGSISEMSPDFGCFTQAWTAYGVFTPIVRYFFGIQPDPAGNRIKIRPVLPAGWDQVSLENVAVLDGTVSIYIKKTLKEIKVVNHTSASIDLEGNFELKRIEE